MKKLITLFIAFSTLLVLSYHSMVQADSDSAKYKINLATVAPDGSSWVKIMEDMNKELKKKTSGEVAFNFYTGGRAGEEGAVLEKMRYGEFHAAGLTGLGLGKILPELRVMEVPLLFESYEEYDYVLKKFTRRFWSKIYAKDYVLLGWAEGGFVNIFSKKEVSTLQELRQTDFWVRQGDPFLEGVFEGFGLKAISLGLPDVLPRLQTGRIDTLGVSPLACLALQWQEEVKYRINLPIYNIMAGLVMTKKAWSNLPKSHKRTLYKTVRRYAHKLTEASRKDNREAKKKLNEMGIKVIKPTAEEIKEWKAQAHKVGDKLAEKKIYPKSLLKKTRKLVKKYREKNKK